ncbi:MAG TPA: diguanylate cyclase [Actinoplanes sp.]
MVGAPGDASVSLLDGPVLPTRGPTPTWAWWGEALRAAVADEPIPTRTGPVTVTISVGVAVRQGQDETPDTLLGRADAGLYAAEQSGRNRVVAHRP